MPIPQRSLTGKIPYDVEQQLRDLTQAVNQLDATRGAASTDALHASVDRLTVTVTTLQQRLDALAVRVAQLEQAATP